MEASNIPQSLRDLLPDNSKPNQIGQGTFGKVFKSTYQTKNGESVTAAIKKIPMSAKSEGIPISSIREINVLNSCHHPNLISLLDIFIVKPTLNNRNGHIDLVFEYMEHDMSALLEAKIEFTMGEIKNIMYQILTGIQFLHSNYIIHRDIKTANILLDNKSTIKLGDFGLARKISPISKVSKQYSSNVVTLWYRSPELLLGMKNYDGKVDMWSIGCVFAELLIGEPLFKSNNEIEQLQKIFSICGSPTALSWEWCKNLPLYDERMEDTQIFENVLRTTIDNKSKLYIDDVAFDLLEKLLTLNPRERIDANAALRHPFFLPQHKVQMCPIHKIDKEYHNYIFKRNRDQLFGEKDDIDMLIAKKDRFENENFYVRETKKRGKIIGVEDEEKKATNSLLGNEAEKRMLSNLDVLFRK